MAYDTLNPLHMTIADLAPADLRSHEFDFTGFSSTQLTTPMHPRFEMAYQALWNEFGAANEMEERDVIAARMQWLPESPVDGYAMLYAMTAFLHNDGLAAVRDHTSIVDVNDATRPVIVHLSHVLIADQFRGTGLAGWMRALPIRSARECLSRAQLPSRQITLVAEMEAPLAGDAGRLRRLTAYEKVGFTKLDPSVVHYRQPDFRTPAAIDAGGGAKPVPLQLVIRRVGREREATVDAAEVAGMIDALHAMYARTFRESDMASLRSDLDCLPPAGTPVALIPPSR
jgi:hypothetical protein